MAVQIQMRTSGTVLLLTFLMIGIGAEEIFSQSSVKDSTFNEKAESNALVQYSRIMRYQALIFNGSEYNEFDGNSKEFPYFYSEYIEEGAIRYDNELYLGIPLFYDLTTDELIIEHYNQSGYQVLIKLRQDRVQSFSVFDHTFQRLSGDSLNRIKTGFYDLLYDGDLKFYAKRKKIYHEEINTNEIIIDFLERTNYYLFKDGIYHPVKRKGSVLKALKDQKKILNQYASKTNLDFRRESSYVELVRYYDNLKNE